MRWLCRLPCSVLRSSPLLSVQVHTVCDRQQWNRSWDNTQCHGFSGPKRSEWSIKFMMARQSLDAAAARYPCTIKCLDLENRTISPKLQMSPVFMSWLHFHTAPPELYTSSVESGKALVGVKLGIVPLRATSTGIRMCIARFSRLLFCSDDVKS